MGEPVRIIDLARDVVRLSGRDPDSQPFDIIGLRPGEKLHEELFYDAEHVEGTTTPKVLRAVSDPPPVDIRASVGQLMEHATGTDDVGLRQLLRQMAMDGTAAADRQPQEIGRPGAAKAGETSAPLGGPTTGFQARRGH